MEMLIDLIGEGAAQDLTDRIARAGNTAGSALAALHWFKDHQHQMWPPGVYVKCSSCNQFRDDRSGPFTWMSNGETYCGDCR